jgi:hypothetical protein
MDLAHSLDADWPPHQPMKPFGIDEYSATCTVTQQQRRTAIGAQDIVVNHAARACKLPASL